MATIPDVEKVIEAKLDESVNAWRLDLLTYMFKNYFPTIHPTLSAAYNICTDGSGMNCGKKVLTFFEVDKGSVFQETTSEALNALARAVRGSFYSAFRCCYSLTRMYKVRLTIGFK